MKKKPGPPEQPAEDGIIITDMRKGFQLVPESPKESTLDQMAAMWLLPLLRLEKAEDISGLSDQEFLSRFQSLSNRYVKKRLDRLGLPSQVVDSLPARVYLFKELQKELETLRPLDSRVASYHAGLGEMLP